MSKISTYALWGGVDCGENAKPKAQLWKECGGTRWGYSIDSTRWGYSIDSTGSGDDLIELGFATEQEARQAAFDYVREWMEERASEAIADAPGDF